MELIDIYDENKNFLETIPRDDTKKFFNNFIKVVHIYVNIDDKYLIQKRALTKNIKPGELEITTGAVTSGENPLDAARRELQEELSIVEPKESFVSLGDFRGEKTFQYVYFLKSFINISNIKLQKEEVDSIYLLSKKDMISFVENNMRRSQSYKQSVINMIKDFA
ncbi:MAG: NUDIX domain-containing protein [Tissierellia bacterium]|nr:NUDIX domain-containing protein [Tissierellia bacterium]